MRRRTRWILVSTVLILAGCGSAQKVSVRSDPIGAEVYLQRRGELEITAEVKGIPGKVSGTAFEEDFQLLGNAPVEYEFDLSEKDVGIDAPGGSGSITRHYREGTIRVERRGYETVVRLVRFSGSPIDLMITLQPLSED